MKKLNLILLSLSLAVTAQAAYEDHFPTYFEYCSGTQWKRQNGDEGGSPGHGFVYIHGLCKDYRSEYPQVIPCSEVSAELRQKYPHEGVGISLDKNFVNVMWVAVPGREFMLNGNRKPQPMMMADVEAQVKKVIELKIFNEVKSKSDKLSGYTFGTPEYVAAISLDTLGTDHAPNWARELHCVKIPALTESLPKVAEFLNQSNNQYRTGKEYEWSKLANNCVHISINASHVMGISKSIKTDQKHIKLLSNMALPSNGFMMYADLAVTGKVPSVRLLSKVLPKKGFYPAQVGSIMEVHKAFPTGEYFNTDHLKVLTAPRVKKPHRLLETPRKYEEKFMTAQTSNLKANAEMWIERYEGLIKALKPEQQGSAVEDYLLKQLELSKNIAAHE